MKTNKQIDAEIEHTLRALDGIKRASPRPFFVTRTEARLDSRLDQLVVGRWAFRPAYLLVSLGVITLLNLSAIVVYQHQLSVDEQQQATESFAAQWKLDPAMPNW